jgi:hypothetical protein
MPLGLFECAVLQLLAANRNPESFVAGATILNQRDDSPRRSADVDLFHDTAESVQIAHRHDRALLSANGFEVTTIINQPSFLRCLVSKDAQQTQVEWAFDTAFRFFPSERDHQLGWRLSFWDAATLPTRGATGGRLCVQ